MSDLVRAPSGQEASGGAPPSNPGARSDELPGWLEEVEPPVPPELAPLLALPGAPGSFPSVETLTRGALEALCRSTAGGAARQGAWELLAADALLTYACQAALEGKGNPPDEVLEDLVREVIDGGGLRGQPREEERHRS